jgi:hypothetical protein
MSDPSKTRPHTLDLVDQILSGTMPPDEARRLLSSFDRKGLTPVTFAALSTARDAHDLLVLKQLLDPPQEGEQSKMDLVIALLERIAESQARLEESQARQERLVRQIASVLGGRPGPSRTPQAATRTGSGG